MGFETELNYKIDRINEELKKYLTPKYPESIYEAMNYSVFAGGKRLRPVLMIAACEAMGENIEEVLPFACALEMIHTYSLIHDDLPAMDNDDYRRGKLTCHKQFNEATAILAGDCLLNYAHEIMLKEAYKKFERKYVRAAKIISQYSGTQGMIVGQVVDIESENKKIDDKTLMYIHDNKTGGLIKAALMAGAIIAGANEDEISAFEKIGYNIGMAFQIKDDILDVTSTQEVLGKAVFSDDKNNKMTYVSIFGLKAANEDYLTLSEGAVKLISDFGPRADFLKTYAEKLINRIK